jgi:hypothetical protein
VDPVAVSPVGSDLRVRSAGNIAEVGDDLLRQPALELHLRAGSGGPNPFVVSVDRLLDRLQRGLPAERIESQNVAQQAGHLAVEAVQLGQAIVAN